MDVIPFWIWLVGVPAVAVLASLLVLATLLRLVLWVARRKPRRYFARYVRAHSWIAPAVILVSSPAVLAYFATRVHHTRDDEAFYAGPEIDAKGDWKIAERRKRADRAAAGPTPAAENPFVVHLVAADGVRLRGFLVPARTGVAPRAVVILVHGLFRGGLEIEPPASMFRDLGATVLLLELRNHGGSDTAVSSFGAAERRDVIAAAEFVRSRPELGGVPLVLFGVSLGSAAVALAAEVLSPPPAAVVLDSAMSSLESAVECQLRENIGMPQPFRFLIERGLELSCGFRIDDVQPARALATLGPELRALIVGGADDDLMPPSAVQEAFSALRTERKELWIVPGAGHGKAWKVDPEGYRKRLGRLIDGLSPGD